MSGTREIVLGDADHLALAEIDADTQTSRTEYAVVYHLRGRIVASGPYPNRAAAAGVAEARSGGVLVERTVQVTHGEWTPAK